MLDMDMKSLLAEQSPSSPYWSDGLAVFRHFLRSEFSEENLDFWLAVERFKKTHPKSKMAARAAKIYDEFICTSAGRQVPVCLSLSSDLFNDWSCDAAALSPGQHGLICQRIDQSELASWH